MIELFNEEAVNEPKILVIGIGGGGNNALDRMISSNLNGTCYAAMNTDIQVLNDCSADQKIQLGKKLTNGFGAGASSDIGEAAAKESEEEMMQIFADFKDNRPEMYHK